MNREEMKRCQRRHDAGFWIMLIVMVVLVITCSDGSVPK